MSAAPTRPFVEAGTGAPAATPRLRVLIAEDIGGSRQLLASLLRQLASVEIHEVADGAAVAPAHRQIQPHVTFLDLGLPTRTGLEALAEIREQDAQAFVVIVSGNGDSQTLQQSVALGVNGFVVKPYSPRRIADALQRYLARPLVAALAERE